jgi:acyl-coenzyme A thioesterase PaaI-like protein
MVSVFNVDNQVVTASEYASGPWNPSLQHGGAAASIATWFAEREPTKTAMRIARVTVELCRPAPIGTFHAHSTIIRDGGKIQVCDVDLNSGGTAFAKARFLKMRTHELALPDATQSDPLDLPMPEHCPAPSRPSALMDRKNFASAFSLRVASGKLWSIGNAAVWFRFEQSMVNQEPVSPAMRAVMAADFGNGLSPQLPFDEWTYINADLTVHLVRLPVGEWILVNPQTALGPDGCGLATARLADVHGYFGSSAQNLVIERRSGVRPSGT